MVKLIIINFLKLNNFEYLIIFEISQLQQFGKWLILQITNFGNFIN